MAEQSSYRKIRGFVVDQQSGNPVSDVVLLFSAETTDNNKKVTFPLGMLVTDVAGYASFDLSSYPENRLPKIIIVTPLGDEQAQISLDIALRVQPEWKVQYILKVYLSRVRMVGKSYVGLASIQNPDAIDREVSPHSFTVKSELVLGEGECQVPVPPPFPVRDFQFARVVLVTDVQIDEDNLPSVEKFDPTTALEERDDTSKLQIRFANVLIFRQRWYSLGHALGEIVYSLPLAPCESVNLAVIEWSRQDSVIRKDDVTAREALYHDQRRDREIEESVGAALREAQTGFSLMGGSSHADSAGAAATIPIYGIPVDVNAASSNVLSWGGAIAHTNGSRDITADSLQELHDHIRQATSVVRSLTSTVIVQSTQQEQSVVQTRTVTNHNHCHALTVQYYEVLRSLKLVTEFDECRRVVLIPYTTIKFDRAKALRFRTILESVLLDSNLKPCFDALVRLEIGDDAYATEAPAESTPETTPAKDYFSGSKSFTAALGTAIPANDVTDTRLLIEEGSTVGVTATGQGIKFSSYDWGGGYGPQGEAREAKAPFPYTEDNAHEYELLAQIGGDFYRIGAGITLTAKHEGNLVFRFNDWKLDDNSGSADVTVNVTRPTANEPTVPEPKDDDKKDSAAVTKKGDEICEKLLLTHLKSNLGYYNRAIWLLQDSVERRILLEALLEGTGLADLIDEMPVAVSGRWVAFPIDDPKLANVLLEPAEKGTHRPKKSEPLVDYVYLPTRGLFAEAQLGHCNSCEVRDVTRVWQWDESPCPPAPQIENITPGPKGESVPIPQPATLPNPVVQVMQAPSAPDPVGLAAALKLLGTPNIFRDMSGLDEVSKLLEQLTSGAVTSMQEAQKLAQEAHNKLNAEKAKVAVGGSGTSQKQTPAERYDNLQVAKEVAKSADELGLNDQQKSELSQDIISGGGGGGILDQFLKTVLGATPSAAKPLSVPGIRWCCQLGINSGIEPVDVKDHKYGSTSTDNCGYLYTEKAGLLDIGHIRDHVDLTKYVYDAIRAGQPTIPCREGTAVFLQSPADPIATAQAIAYIDSWSHELISFGGLQDFSAFAPEDLPSNFLGTYIGARALAMLGSSGSFDAIVDTLLTGVLASLGVHSKADTDAVIASKKAKWWDYGLGVPPIKLLRRNFDSTPWFAGAAFDNPPAPAFIDASTLTPVFKSFDYTSKPLADGSIAKLVDFPAITDKIRAPFKAAGADKP